MITRDCHVAKMHLQIDSDILESGQSERNLKGSVDKMAVMKRLETGMYPIGYNGWFSCITVTECFSFF